MHIRLPSLTYCLLLAQLHSSDAKLCQPSNQSSHLASTTAQTNQYASTSATPGTETPASTSDTLSSSVLTAEPTAPTSSARESTILETESVAPTSSTAEPTTLETESLAPTPTSETQASTTCAPTEELAWDQLSGVGSDGTQYPTYIGANTGYYADTYSLFTTAEGHGIRATFQIDPLTGRFNLALGDGSVVSLATELESDRGYSQAMFWPSQKFQDDGTWGYINCNACESGDMTCSMEGSESKVYFLASPSLGVFFTTKQDDLDLSGYYYVKPVVTNSKQN